MHAGSPGSTCPSRERSRIGPNNLLSGSRPLPDEHSGLRVRARRSAARHLQRCGSSRAVAVQERSFTQHDAATRLHPQRPARGLLGSDATLEGAAAEDGDATRDPDGTTTLGLAALEHREFHIQRPPPHLQRPSKLSAALPKRAVLHIQSPAVHDTFGEAACRVVPAAPMSRTSLACVRASKTNGALSSRYTPGARWITTGTPAVALDRSAARATSRLQLTPLSQLLSTA
eukprot:scaffold17208_cov75-Phaeocystis_antarctica.AAC.1